MKIDHIAIWTRQLDPMREFYERYFNGRSSPRYTNPRTGFQSYFVSFGDGARLELMQMEGMGANPNTAVTQHLGYIHLAMSVGGETADGGEAAVDALTNRLRQDGYPVLGEPRRTGDGYYESVILDPDGNRIEITV
ncbi:MAG: VOC family protein [Chloroflexi bacterium]|nr:VOC family protein [Chloroflexota bacterium]